MILDGFWLDLGVLEAFWEVFVHFASFPTVFHEISRVFHTAYFTEISCDYVVLRRLAPLQWYLDPLPRVGGWGSGIFRI